MTFANDTVVIVTNLFYRLTTGADMPSASTPNTPEFRGYGMIWVTESNSRPGVLHTTILESDGEWQCSCEAMTFRGHCRHVDELKIMVAGGTGDEGEDDFQISF